MVREVLPPPMQILTAPVLGHPCDADGYNLPPGTPPSPSPARKHDWTPFTDRIEFELADFLFTKVRNSCCCPTPALTFH